MLDLLSIVQNLLFNIMNKAAIMNRDPFCNNPHMNLVYTSHKGVNVWLGNFSSAVDLKSLKKFQIHAVLTVASELNIIEFPPESAIIHKVVPAIDAPSYKMRPHFSPSSQFILENISKGKNVLVHCSSGISRSATIVIAFFMQKLNLSYLRAYALLKNKRHLIDPNYGFKEQLIQFEKKLSGLQILKEQLKKPESCRNISSIESYLNSQKHKQSSKLKWIIPMKAEINDKQPKSFRLRSIRSMSEEHEQTRKRSKSEATEMKRSSLPKIHEYK